MASDTRNVKLGVCKITFNGVDLGYTKGGVDVEVKTNTHKVMVDQFGNSEINEYILGRTLSIKAPLAETTVDNLVSIMPGSTKAVTAGVKAAGSIAFAAVPAPNDTITIDGLVIKFVASGATGNQVNVGGTAALTVTALLAFLAASTDPRMALFTFGQTTSTLNVTYATEGVAGNSILMASSAVNGTVVQLTGGVDPVKRADVQSGVGISLLGIAKVLVLHPVANAANDLSDDFTVPLCATAGAMKYAYKLDAERIFDCEFVGYPDPVTKLLFMVGSPAAGS